MSRLEKVFVYGTLKKGEPNHSWILDTSKGFSNFLCKAETVEKYPLIIGTKYNIPFLLDAPGLGHNVIGELYEVNESMLSHLDILEDHPNLYVRDLREVNIIPNGQLESKTATAWIYLLKTFPHNLLEELYIEEYFSTGCHGKPYAERYTRDKNFSVKSDIQEGKGALGS